MYMGGCSQCSWRERVFDDRELLSSVRTEKLEYYSEPSTKLNLLALSG
jgi:hypothetical protein